MSDETGAEDFGVEEPGGKGAEALGVDGSIEGQGARSQKAESQGAEDAGDEGNGGQEAENQGGEDTMGAGGQVSESQGAEGAKGQRSEASEGQAPEESEDQGEGVEHPGTEMAEVSGGGETEVLEAQGEGADGDEKAKQSKDNNEAEGIEGVEGVDAVDGIERAEGVKGAWDQGAEDARGQGADGTSDIGDVQSAKPLNPDPSAPRTLSALTPINTDPLTTLEVQKRVEESKRRRAELIPQAPLVLDEATGTLKAQPLKAPPSHFKKRERSLAPQPLSTPDARAPSLIPNLSAVDSEALEVVDRLDILDQSTSAELRAQLAEAKFQAKAAASEAQEIENKTAMLLDEIGMIRKELANQGPEMERARDNHISENERAKELRTKHYERAIKNYEKALVVDPGSQRLEAQKLQTQNTLREVLEEISQSSKNAEEAYVNWVQEREVRVEELRVEAGEAETRLQAVTRIRDQWERECFLVTRALGPVELRECQEGELLADNQVLVEEVLRKHALHVSGVEHFEEERKVKELKSRGAEELTSFAFQVSRLKTHGTETRSQLDSFFSEVVESLECQEAEGPNSKRLGPSVKTLETYSYEGADAEVQEETVAVQFVNSDNGLGVDRMNELRLQGDLAIDALVDIKEGDIAKSQEADDGVELEEEEYADSLSKEEVRRLVAEQKERWRVQLPWMSNGTSEPPRPDTSSPSDPQPLRHKILSPVKDLGATSKSIALSDMSIADQPGPYKGEANPEKMGRWIETFFLAEHPAQDLQPFTFPEFSPSQLRSQAAERLKDVELLLQAQRAKTELLFTSAKRLLDQAKVVRDGAPDDILALVDSCRMARSAQFLFAQAFSIGFIKITESSRFHAEAQKLERDTRQLIVRWFGEDALHMMDEGTPLIPSAVKGEKMKKFEQQAKQYSDFNSAQGVDAKPQLLIFELMNEGLEDSRIIDDRRLLSIGVKLTLEELKVLRMKYDQQEHINQVITDFQSGKLSEEEYTLKRRDIENWYRGEEKWDLVNGKWHFRTTPGQGFVWKLNNFLQMAEGDFDNQRRNKMYAMLTNTIKAKDGWGRNMRMTALAKVEEELRGSVSFKTFDPSLPNTHGGALRDGLRSNWSSSTQSPWKATSSKKTAADGPSCDYDPFVDAQKSLDVLPTGDHIHILSQPRSSWNSASFALQTAGSKAQWNDLDLQEGRGKANATPSDLSLRGQVSEALRAFSQKFGAGRDQGQASLNPHTLNPAPCTLHPKPLTTNSKTFEPCTLNLEP